MTIKYNVCVTFEVNIHNGFLLKDDTNKTHVDEIFKATSPYLEIYSEKAVGLLFALRYK